MRVKCRLWSVNPFGSLVLAGIFGILLFCHFEIVFVKKVYINLQKINNEKQNKIFGILLFCHFEIVFVKKVYINLQKINNEKQNKIGERA